MMSGDWNKEKLQVEVQAHDVIVACKEMQNKLKHTRPRDHECISKFYLYLEYTHFAT